MTRFLLFMFFTTLFFGLGTAACGPDGYVFHPPEEREVFVPVPGETEVITVTTTDTTAVNSLIRIIETQQTEIDRLTKESMWLRRALEEIVTIECGFHPDQPNHQHREEVCIIARDELAR